MFTINFLFVIYSQLPSFLRTPKRLAWLQLMVKGLKDIQTDFAAFRLDANRQATYTGQVMVLERMLNLVYYGLDDTYATASDPTAGGHIYIEKVINNLPSNYTFYESEGQAPKFIYLDSEAQPPTYGYFSSEYYSLTSFVVKVPVSLGLTASQLNAMRSRIDKYIIAGFNYTIQTY